MPAFSQRLAALRAERGLSQAQIAKEVGVVVRAYQRYEYGQREPQLAVLIRIADFYGVSLDYLAGRSGEPGLPGRGGGRPGPGT